MSTTQMAHPLDEQHLLTSHPVGERAELVENPSHTELPMPSGPPLPPPDGPPHGTAPRPRWRKLALIAAIVALVAGGVAVLVTRLTPRADITVDSLVAPETIVEGEVLTVDVHVSNTGEADGARDITLTDNGLAVETLAVEVTAETETDVSFEVADLAAGTHVLGIEGWADLQASVRVLTPARFVIDDVTVGPDEVLVGEELTVRVAYSNLGEADGSYELVLELGNVVVDERTVSLDGTTSGEEVFTLTAEGRGFTLVSVNGRSVRVTVLAPATFEVDAIEVDPSPADANSGLPVSVVVSLSNSGDVEGVHTLDVTVDGTVIESRAVTLAGGQTTEEVFTFVPSHPGINVIGVSGQTVDVDVYQLQRPDHAAVLVNEFNGGPNRLKIDNQRERDMIVVLTDPADTSRPLFAVYVHANSTATLRGIPSGVYTTFYADGADWCVFYERFTSNARYGRFEGESVFTANQSSYTIVTLTFGASDGDWSPTTDVDEDDFPG